MSDLKRYIRDIPGFPKPGIVFKDITPLLAHSSAFHAAVDQLTDRYHERVDVVLGIESRGFIIGAAVAYSLGCGLALVRKAGKLPAETYATSYELEYGADTVEIHQDAFPRQSRVLVVDDLLATGGTAKAAVELVKRLEGRVIECAFVVELAFLGGRERLSPHGVFSLISYEQE
jgi:adenine phosphoribosyltransferase